MNDTDEDTSTLFFLLQQQSLWSYLRGEFSDDQYAERSEYLADLRERVVSGAYRITMTNLVILPPPPTGERPWASEIAVAHQKAGAK